MKKISLFILALLIVGSLMSCNTASMVNNNATPNTEDTKGISDKNNSKNTNDNMDLDVLFKESILSNGYPINENGDTYGPNIGNEMLGEPDLISAVGKDGNKGYVYTKELGGKQPDNPEEAVAITKENERKGSWTIPLYEKDGETQIGEFEIGN